MNTLGRTSLCTSETGTITRSAASALTFGQMAESTTVSGPRMTCLVMAFICTKMVYATMENIKQTKKMVSAITSGLTGVNILAGGPRANSTAWVPIWIPSREVPN